MNELVTISRKLSRDVDALSFELPVAHVLNPLDYARAPQEAYLCRYGEGRKRVILLGMNPGPFGMAQTGVPFGDVSMVREFLGIEEPVRRHPKGEHPKRKVLGFECTRSEVSGTRLWGWVRDRFGTADAFFAEHFVMNYCPLVFLEEGGRNRTPDKLKVAERRALYEVCDRAFRRSVEVLAPELIIGVGRFAQTRAREALDGLDVEISWVLHPSPASPAANRGWAEAADQAIPPKPS